jgi:hypothetical protein
VSGFVGLGVPGQDLLGIAPQQAVNDVRRLAHVG